MTAPWLPAPRPALDDELEQERAVAAAVTRHDRREHEAVCAAPGRDRTVRGGDVSALPIGGFGIVGVGVGGDPSPKRTRPDLCAENGHPGVTYNPLHDCTWCLCGANVQPGNTATHAACCGGPLQATS